ncbi:hypothetical protein ACH5RR_008889 [Cinchona calisaya]|uniref:SWIM-type domain-containing protein n=1 Tax=Cinchona calisaya TaxID=153742 RepID=A0ABD3AFM3_9GENT
MTLGNNIPSIKRMFVGIDALKKGFLASCLPFIGFDGCHLKGPYREVLLFAIGIDGNNGPCPIAYAIVESENKESWLFFFEWLSTLLEGFSRDRPWTFMIDRQMVITYLSIKFKLLVNLINFLLIIIHFEIYILKGLIYAISSKVPPAINRKCCRHILSNFRGKFPGALPKQLFWQAAWSYNEQNFKEAMVKMKALKLEAYEWLDKVPTKLWARHAFPTDLKNAHITNNIFESFNNWVGDLRGKPVLTLVDSIRAKLMNRLQKRFEKACMFKNKVVPHVRKKLNEIAKECRKCILLFASGNEFQINECNVSYIVDIKERTCNCKVWNLTGIPCKHAVAILINKKADLESYCDYSLTKDFYFKVYNEVIHPILDVEFWPPMEVNPSKVLPPVLRRKASRPKKARRREPGAALVVGHMKRSSTLKCSLCQQFGLNKRGCQGGPKRDRKGNFKRRKVD